MVATESVGALSVWPVGSLMVRSLIDQEKACFVGSSGIVRVEPDVNVMRAESGGIERDCVTPPNEMRFTSRHSMEVVASEFSAVRSTFASLIEAITPAR